MTNPLPEPLLTKILRLEASLGEALDVGNVAQGRRRIVPLTGGTFAGPELNGTLLPGASADWQIVLPDGTALGDIRYTLQTDHDDLLYVRSQGVRHGSAEVLARLARGEEVDASEYVFRTSTQIETAAPDRLAEQGRVYQCRRTPTRRRDLRGLPRRMNSSSDSTRQPASSPSGRRVAIITGGSQGIGAGLVSGFRRGGYGVVATSRSIGAADEDDYLTVRGDIAEVQTARNVVEQALDRFARIDCLVNDAGVFIGKSFTDYTLDDYLLITSVNLAGFFHLTQRVIGQMITQGSGHVVNVTTSLVDNADSKRPAALPALTKGGLAAATRSLAIEYASRGIRVNAVALGVIRTRDDPTSYAGMADLHPLGRLGEIGDVVDGVLYLERATFVTGETLHIDGGQAAGS